MVPRSKFDLSALKITNSLPLLMARSKTFLCFLLNQNTAQQSKGYLHVIMESASPETQHLQHSSYNICRPMNDDEEFYRWIKKFLKAIDEEAVKNRLCPSEDVELKMGKLAALGVPQWQLRRIEEILDEAAQRFVVENLLLISSREDILNSFHDRMTNLVLEYALIKIQRDRDVAGPSARSDGPDVPMDMPKEDIPAEQKNPHLPFRDVGGPSARVDGLPDVPIDMPKDVLAEQNNPHLLFRDVGGHSVRGDGSPGERIDMPEEDHVPAEQKNPDRPFKELVKSAADFIKKEGLMYLSNPSTNDPRVIWAKTIIEIAKILGYVFTAAGHGVWNYNNRLSRFFIKAGGVATASAVILHLVLPLQPVVAWIVGPVAWLIVVAVILFLSD